MPGIASSTVSRDKLVIWLADRVVTLPEKDRSSG